MNLSKHDEWLEDRMIDRVAKRAELGHQERDDQARVEWKASAALRERWDDRFGGYDMWLTNELRLRAEGRL